MRIPLAPIGRMLCAALAALAACDSPGTPEGPARAEAPTAAAAGDSPITKKRAVLADYERVRAGLAKDAIDAALTDARSLEQSARTAAGSGDANKVQWTALADEARALGALKSDDPEAVRKAFGEVSRQLLPLLRADESLGQGLHVFRCPMAQGYEKWVQPSDKLENPYMGTRMLACGSEVSL